MASDFHTHKPKSAARALVSLPPERIGEYPLASLELHPWRLPEKLEPLGAEFFAAAERAAALGEAGLDRLRGPSLEVQQAYLAEVLKLARELGKPVVFHCVRALPELLHAVRNFPGNKLFHGFRGKPEALEQLRKHGFYVSLGTLDLLPYLRQAGFERIGFETDDSELPIESILAEASLLAERDLEEETDRTFDAFLGKERKC